MTKTEVRKQIKAVLQENVALLPVLSEKICKKIIDSPEYKTADVVFAYMALPDEVDLTPVIEDALGIGKKVFIPRIIPGTDLMEFFQLQAGAKAGAGSYGILEPQEDWPKFNFDKRGQTLDDEVQNFDKGGQTPNINEQILVLTPGRAFTLAGQRLGRGKGFYDTFFADLKKWQNGAGAGSSICIAGVCFGCQVVKELPVESHDIEMQIVFTI